MKLSKLLTTRDSILRQAHLASLAHAYSTTKRLADRVALVRLGGRVRLQPVAPAEERFLATLTALEGEQSVIEEHFTDEDILDLADAATIAIASNYAELEFRLEELGEHFVAPLRDALEQAGVVLDLDRPEPNFAPGNAAE
jgi:hypothetical protein